MRENWSLALPEWTIIIILFQKQGGREDCRNDCFAMAVPDPGVAGSRNYDKGSFAERIRQEVIRARQNSEWSNIRIGK